MAKSNSKPKVRLRDIAEKAEISISAVSMALADHPGIGEQTKRRVRQLSREMGYRSTRVRAESGNGAEKDVYRFGFLLLGARLEDEVVSGCLHGLTTSAATSGDRIEITAIEDASDPHLVARRALEYAKDLDGLLLMGMVGRELLTRLEESNIPSIVLGHAMVDPGPLKLNNTLVITSDEIAMGLLAAARLIECGHTRIGFLCEHLIKGLAHSHWLAGYAWAHAAAKLPTDPALAHTSGGSAAAEQAAVAFTQLDAPPTAFVVPDARVAARFLQAMGKRGCKVPDTNIVIGSQVHLVKRYHIEYYPLILEDLDQLAGVAVRELRLLCQQGPRPRLSELLVPFVHRNLPEPAGGMDDAAQAVLTGEAT